jgi:hypothetical protein
MVRSFSKLFFAATFVLLGFACQKEVQGPQGEPGTPGANGKDATPPVIVNFLITAGQWSTTVDSVDYRTSYFTDKLTKDVLERGAVQVYMQVDNTWWALPYGSHDETMIYGIEEKLVRLTVYNSHSGLPDKVPTRNYRLVIIPPL